MSAAATAYWVVCANADCDWSGLSDDCACFKHWPALLLCPECYEVVERVKPQGETPMQKPSQAALPAGAAATEGRAIPPRRASGRGGCCATCHRQQAQVIALLEALALRGMPSFSPCTPEAYLAGLYQAAADRALRAGAEVEPGTDMCRSH
jgi:hypothetical protein